MEIEEKPYLAKYEVGLKISEDQISKMYSAYDKISGEKLVIRFFEFEESDTDLIEIFNSDLSLISEFDHHRLVKFYKFEDANYPYCIIRKHLTGRSLYAIISSKKYELPQELIVKIIFEICEAIKYIHEMGIIHGFLSPSNILIENNQVKVINHINYSLLKNTYPNFYQILYFSPEQIKGDEVDQRADIYAIGIILYQLFTGKNPYSNDISLGVSGISESILDDTPTIPSLYNLDISAELEHIILKAMEKNKEERYFSIQELENDLKECFKNISYNNYNLFSNFESTNSESDSIGKIAGELVVKQKLKIEDDITSNKNQAIKTFSWIKDITNDFLITKAEEFDEIAQRFNDNISGLAIADNRYYIPLYKSLPLVCLDYSKSDFSYKETLKNIIDRSEEIELRTCSKRNEEVAVLIHNILSPSSEFETFKTIDDFKVFFEKRESFTGVIRFNSNVKKIRVLNLEKDLLFSTMIDAFFENKFEFKNITDEYDLKNFINAENFNIVIYDLAFHNDVEPYIAEMNTVVFIATGKKTEILAIKSTHEGKFKNLLFIEKSLSVEYFNNIKAYINKISEMTQPHEYTYHFAYLNGERKFALQSSKETGKTNVIYLGTQVILSAQNIKSFEAHIKISDFCVSSIWENTNINISYKKNNEFTMESLLNGIVSNNEKNISEIKKNLLTETEHNLNFYFSASKNILNSVYYKFSEWVLNNYFFDVFTEGREKEFKVIINNIALIKKITFFKYVEKYVFDIIFHESSGYLTVVCFGAGNDFALIDFVEKIKEENNNSSSKIKSAFYVSFDSYTEPAISFYNDISKSKGFFDKNAKLKGFVKSSSEENDFQLILIERNELLFKLFENLKEM